MKIRDIMENASVGATGAGAVAPVVGPIGGVLTRTGSGLLTGKYTSAPTPNTPAKYKRKKRAS